LQEEHLLYLKVSVTSSSFREAECDGGTDNALIVHTYVDKTL